MHPDRSWQIPVPAEAGAWRPAGYVDPPGYLYPHVYVWGQYRSDAELEAAEWDSELEAAEAEVIAMLIDGDGDDWGPMSFD